jgi:enoyl-CoA hydratase/carnithine racemase
LRRLRECPKPTIAMIEGYCVGGGLAVATHADIRIASEESIFGIPAARLGIAYSFDKLSKLVELVGPAAAKDILFTGRRLQADEAHRIGLLTRVVPKATLRTAVSDYTTMIVENAPLSVQAAKFTIHQVTLPAGDRDMETVAGMARRCFDSRDYREGREAFAAKRRPEFVGE